MREADGSRGSIAWNVGFIHLFSSGVQCFLCFKCISIKCAMNIVTWHDSLYTRSQHLGLFVMLLQSPKSRHWRQWQSDSHPWRMLTTDEHHHLHSGQFYYREGADPSEKATGTARWTWLLATALGQRYQFLCSFHGIRKGWAIHAFTTSLELCVLLIPQPPGNATPYLIKEYQHVRSLELRHNYGAGLCSSSLKQARHAKLWGEDWQLKLSTKTENWEQSR